MSNASAGGGNATAGLPALEKGAVRGPVSTHLTRESMVRYAGASGDFNPIHYRDDIALAAGLPGVLAHGMLTFGLAAAAVVEWVAAGDAARVLSLETTFTRPVVVDADEGADVLTTVTITDIDDDVIRVQVKVEAAGKTVLGRCRASVRR